MKAVETASRLLCSRHRLKAGINETLDAVRGIPVPRCRSMMSLSDHAELHSAGFADHVLIPRGIPDQLHIGFVDAVDA